MAPASTSAMAPLRVQHEHHTPPQPIQAPHPAVAESPCYPGVMRTTPPPSATPRCVSAASWSTPAVAAAARGKRAPADAEADADASAAAAPAAAAGNGSPPSLLAEAAAHKNGRSASNDATAGPVATLVTASRHAPAIAPARAAANSGSGNAAGSGGAGRQNRNQVVDHAAPADGRAPATAWHAVGASCSAGGARRLRLWRRHPRWAGAGGTCRVR